MPRNPKKINPVKIRGVELTYSHQLRQIAGHVGDLINAFPPGEHVHTIMDLLQKYAATLDPWARATASKILANVAKRDEQAWKSLTREMSLSLRNEILNAPTGEVMRLLLEEQVTLIKSLPLEAAQRVHKLVLEGMENSSRASEIAKEIMRSGDVAKSRAMLIARTETSRAASVLTQARAQHVGSEGYIWTTSHDEDVRKSHKAMDGKFVRWDSPPTLDKLTGHAGALPNCRCFARVVLPE